MWGGKIEFKTPMLFCIAFLFQFLIAGLTGVMLAPRHSTGSSANSYFVVAHFHYVIVGGIIFALFGAFYYWFPKMSGKMYSEMLGKLAFLAVPHRLPPDLRFHAHSRHTGDAAPNLHLRAGARLGHLESDRNGRSFLSGGGHFGFS